MICLQHTVFVNKRFINYKYNKSGFDFYFYFLYACRWLMPVMECK